VHHSFALPLHLLMIVLHQRSSWCHTLIGDFLQFTVQFGFWCCGSQTDACALDADLSLTTFLAHMLLLATDAHNVIIHLATRVCSFDRDAWWRRLAWSYGYNRLLFTWVCSFNDDWLLLGACKFDISVAASNCKHSCGQAHLRLDHRCRSLISHNLRLRCHRMHVLLLKLLLLFKFNSLLVFFEKS